VLHAAEPMSIETRGNVHVLRLALPFADRDELEVGRHDAELLVRVGPHRRAISLPDSLRRRDVGDARLAGDRLEVDFVERLP